MAELSLTLTSHPDAQERALIGNQLALFNDADVGNAQREDIAVLVREGGALVAGLAGYTAWGWLYVQWLWVGQTQRGQGLAGRMLAAAEAEARVRGCHGAYIDTFNPQALRAYQKAGYAVFGTLENFPTGRNRSFLAKHLD